MKRYAWLMSLLVLMLSWAHAEPATAFKFETCFTTAAAFKRNLELLGAIPDPVRRENTFNAYWNRLVAERKVPFVTQHEAVFLYRGAAQTAIFDGEWSLGYPLSS